ncbi:transposase [Bacillus sp. FJAT-53060]|uniref:transposase n=1 Tax=Bacillus sp. FJAT-53060 TaxID=3127666 RepID=UPI0030134A2E
MKKRVSYPISVKEEAVRMKLIGIPTKEIMDKLGIKNSTQVKTWMKWYRDVDTIGFINQSGNNIHMGKDLNIKMRTKS